MAQVLLLKIDANGDHREMDTANDDVTLKSFAVTGGGPALSASGLAMSNQDITAIKNLSFTAPSTDTLNQTAGALIIDNLMAKERDNLLTTAGGILFPVITDVAGQVDALRLPAIAGGPTATPTDTGDGFLVCDSTGNKLWLYSSGAWLDLSKAFDAKAVDTTGYTAGMALSANDLVYISAADTVSQADNSNSAKFKAIGFTTAAALNAASVDAVRSEGTLGGFVALTAGTKYYMGVTGGITATIPTGAGNKLLQVGMAKNTTTLQIQLMDEGRRA